MEQCIRKTVGELGWADRGALAPLQFAQMIGAQLSFAAFVDGALESMARTLGAELMTFNRLDLSAQRSSVISRPFMPKHLDAVESVNARLTEHPLFAWLPKQSTWPVVRLSDVATTEQLAAWPLYRDVLCPIGATYSLFVFASSPLGAQWVYFVANRSEHDFNDEDLDFMRAVQPALVATLTRWATASGTAASLTLTRREQAVLGYLATGLTADAMAHALGTRSATVRKHLQNVYAKLAVHDRLSAVMRARELGLLHEEDLSIDLAQQIRTEMMLERTSKTGAQVDVGPKWACPGSECSSR